MDTKRRQDQEAQEAQWPPQGGWTAAERTPSAFAQVLPSDGWSRYHDSFPVVCSTHWSSY